MKVLKQALAFVAICAVSMVYAGYMQVHEHEVEKRAYEHQSKSEEIKRHEHEQYVREQQKRRKQVEQQKEQEQVQGEQKQGVESKQAPFQHRLDERVRLEDYFNESNKEEQKNKLAGSGQGKRSIFSFAKVKMKEFLLSLLPKMHKQKAAVKKQLSKLYAKTGEFDKAIDAMHSATYHTREVLKHDIESAKNNAERLAAISEHTQFTQEMFEDLYAQMHGKAVKEGTYSLTLRKQLTETANVINAFTQDLYTMQRDLKIEKQAGNIKAVQELQKIMQVIAPTYGVKNYESYAKNEPSEHVQKKQAVDESSKKIENKQSDGSDTSSEQQQALLDGFIASKSSDSLKQIQDSQGAKTTADAPKAPKSLPDPQKSVAENIKERSKQNEAKGLPVANNLPDPAKSPAENMQQVQSSASEKKVESIPKVPEGLPDPKKSVAENIKERSKQNEAKGLPVANNLPDPRKAQKTQSEDSLRNENKKAKPSKKMEGSLQDALKNFNKEKLNKARPVEKKKDARTNMLDELKNALKKDTEKGKKKVQRKQEVRVDKELLETARRLLEETAQEQVKNEQLIKEYLQDPKAYQEKYSEELDEEDEDEINYHEDAIAEAEALKEKGVSLKQFEKAVDQLKRAEAQKSILGAGGADFMKTLAQRKSKLSGNDGIFLDAKEQEKYLNDAQKQQDEAKKKGAAAKKRAGKVGAKNNKNSESSQSKGKKLTQDEKQKGAAKKDLFAELKKKVKQS